MVQSIWNLIKEKASELWEWVQPEATDSLLLKILKMPLKIAVLLLAAAFSPVALLVLLFAFAAAL